MSFYKIWSNFFIYGFFPVAILSLFAIAIGMATGKLVTGENRCEKIGMLFQPSRNVLGYNMCYSVKEDGTLFYKPVPWKN